MSRNSAERDDLAMLVSPYLDILEPFVQGALPAPDFQEAFTARYLVDERPRSERAFLVLDRFYSDVDEYVEDATLRLEVSGIAPERLRELATRLLDSAGLLAPSA